MARVIGLGGIFFKSPDPAALASWYQQHLGLDIEHWGGCAFHTAQLPSGSYHVWSPFSADSDYFAPSTKGFMFNLMVDDLKGALDQLRAAGAQVMNNTEDSELGNFGWFIDPDGNKVELWQPPANQQQD